MQIPPTISFCGCPISFGVTEASRSYAMGRRGSIRSSENLLCRTAEINLVARHPEVYEPCEDSFALVDALLADRANILGQNPGLCVEVGCGSGYVITSLALIIGRNGATQYVATDISSKAAAVTRETLAAHDVKADVFVTDLVSGLENRLVGAVDVLLFNPPYVPTSDEEIGVGGLTASWAGGPRGRVVIDRMLAIVDSLLSSTGCMYMITLSENNPVEICRIMSEKAFASRIILQRNTEEEKLQVLKFWRN